MKVKQVKATLRSIAHVLNGYQSALDCMDPESQLSDSQIETLRKYFNKELDRVKKGLVPAVEANHAKTDLTGRTEARP